MSKKRTSAITKRAVKFLDDTVGDTNVSPECRRKCAEKLLELFPPAKTAEHEQQGVNVTFTMINDESGGGEDDKAGG